MPHASLPTSAFGWLVAIAVALASLVFSFVLLRLLERFI